MLSPRKIKCVRYHGLIPCELLPREIKLVRDGFAEAVNGRCHFVRSFTLTSSSGTRHASPSIRIILIGCAATVLA
jgi:hypothetical protein